MAAVIRAGRDMWEPIAVHVATRPGIIQRCKASEEATVPGGHRHLPPSAVADRYAAWPALDYAADGLRKGGADSIPVK